MSSATEQQAQDHKPKLAFRKHEVATAVGKVLIVQDQLSGVTLSYHGERHCRRLHSVTCATNITQEELQRHFAQMLQVVQDEEARYLASFKEAQQPLKKEKKAKPLTSLRRKLLRAPHTPQGRIQFAEEVRVRLYRTTTWEKQA